MDIICIAHAFFGPWDINGTKYLLDNVLYLDDNRVLTIQDQALLRKIVNLRMDRKGRMFPVHNGEGRRIKRWDHH
jgi:hypothetical protein